MCIVAPSSGPSRSNRCIGGCGSRIALAALACPGRLADSALDERLLDHEMAGLAVIAFGKTARFEHLAQFLQHGRAAAHHDPIALDIERRLADIVKQLL